IAAVAAKAQKQATLTTPKPITENKSKETVMATAASAVSAQKKYEKINWHHKVSGRLDSFAFGALLHLLSGLRIYNLADVIKALSYQQRKIGFINESVLESIKKAKSGKYEVVYLSHRDAKHYQKGVDTSADPRNILEMVRNLRKFIGKYGFNIIPLLIKRLYLDLTTRTKEKCLLCSEFLPFIQKKFNWKEYRLLIHPFAWSKEHCFVLASRAHTANKTEMIDSRNAIHKALSFVKRAKGITMVLNSLARSIPQHFHFQGAFEQFPIVRQPIETIRKINGGLVGRVSPWPVENTVIKGKNLRAAEEAAHEAVLNYISKGYAAGVIDAFFTFSGDNQYIVFLFPRTSDASSQFGRGWGPPEMGGRFKVLTKEDFEKAMNNPALIEQTMRETGTPQFSDDFKKDDIVRDNKRVLAQNPAYNVAASAAVKANGNSVNSTEAGKFIVKPVSIAFLYYRFAKSFLVIAAAVSAAYFGLLYFIGPVLSLEIYQVSISYIWALLPLMTGWAFLSRYVSYKKESYAFYGDRIIQKGGGIFSDFERELNIKNITHVIEYLPFIENKFFGTGYILIESAGAAFTEIFLSSIALPRQVYENVAAIMQKNGFKLTKEKLIQREHPSTLAAFFEITGAFVITVLGFIQIMSPGLALFIISNRILALAALAAIVSGLMIVSLFKFIDLKLRLYELYEDAIVYKGGFLNTYRAFMPVENLADSSVSQSLLDRLFGLYDVKISSQGSGNEVLFKNIINGEKLSDNIDKVIAAQKTQGAKETTVRDNAAAKHLTVESDRNYTAEFKPSALRIWLPAIVLSPVLIVLLPLGILIAFVNIVLVRGNIFRVKADTVEHTFKFIFRKTKEFSLDKVTAVIIKEDFVDKWLGTFSIRFWSIGSAEAITFSHIKKEAGLAEKILAKKGIFTQALNHNLTSHFTLGALAKAHIYLAALLISGIAAVSLILPYGWISLPVSVLAISVIAAYRALYYKNSRIEFYRDYIHFKEGLLRVDDYYVFYDDIKSIATVKYPLSSKGSIVFDVAGETSYQTKNGAILTANSFTMDYVKNIPALNSILDKIISERLSSGQIKSAAGYISKPSIVNPLFYTFIILAITTAGIITAVSINIPAYILLSAITLGVIDNLIVSAVVIFF
ncbi:MAG: DUF4922 domain-containing protein, partial [Candidatus Omnitrophica bacterium]|nr:DUF4922 domain-containing protein [Candidatus Omnitrophota bacterium]